ncbi:hypothetical protein [Agaribacterium haliotis]|nr:hypothetical protein [Agaribacterium haliotis]
MYIDWVITLSLIIVVLTCVFLGYAVRYAMQKINEVPTDFDTTQEAANAR